MIYLAYGHSETARTCIPAFLTKNAGKMLLNLWEATNIGAAYDWRKAAAKVPADREIADINAKMAAAYEMVNKASWKLNANSPTYRDDVIAFAALLETAKAQIAAADVEFKAVMANR